MGALLCLRGVPLGVQPGAWGCGGELGGLLWWGAQLGVGGCWEGLGALL